LSASSIASLFVIPLVLDSLGWSSDVVSAITSCLSWSAIGVPAVMMTGPIQSLLLAKGTKNPDDSSYRWWSNGINLSGLLVFIGSGSVLCLLLDLGYMGGGLSFSIAHFSRYAVAHLAWRKKLKEYELPVLTFSFKRKIISEILLHSAPLVIYSTFELAWPFLTVIIMGKHYDPFGLIVLTVFSQYNQWGLVFAFSGLQTITVITAKQFSAAQKLIKNKVKLSHDDSDSIYQKALEGIVKYKTNARRTIHAGTKILVLSTSVITILVCAFPDPFIGFYVDKKDQTPSTKNILYFATGISFVETFRSAILGALRSLDDIVYPIIINIGSFWVITASLMGGLVYGANSNIEVVGISILSGMSASSMMLLARFIYIREKELAIGIRRLDSQDNITMNEVENDRQSRSCPSLVPLLLSSRITELNEQDLSEIQIPESHFDFFIPRIKCKSKYAVAQDREEHDEEAELTRIAGSKTHKTIEINQASS
jgi:Na+-driven multidrug efflux pump